MDVRESMLTLPGQQVAILLRSTSFHQANVVLQWAFVTLLIAAIAAPHVGLASLLVWIAVMAVIVTVCAHPRLRRAQVWVSVVSRLAQLRSQDAAAAEGSITRLRAAVLLVGLLYSATALSLFFLPALPLLERICFSFVLLLAVCSGVVGAVGHRPLMYAVTGPMLIPLAVLWVVVPVPSTQSAMQLGTIVFAMEILLVYTMFTQYLIVGDTRRVITDSFGLRLERDDLVRALRVSLDQAESANRAKTRFLASASHDLRQPIQAVSLLASALEMRPLDERSQEIAHCISSALQDLSVELNALLDVSKLDAGTIRPELTSFELLPLLRRIQEVFAATASIKGLSLLVDCPAGACVRTDRNLLERIVRNLLDNAIKYTDAGFVTIDVQRQPDSYQLRIRDTGCGIAEAEHGHVFEEFYQVGNASRNRQGGLGLGLSIVKRLADLLELEMNMHSQPGKGTVFTLDLIQVTGTGILTAHSATRDRWPSPHARVLVVDDEESVCTAMRALLEETGYNVATAHDTASALAAAEQEPPDLLIADFRLGCAGGGLGTIAALRARLPKLRALLLTGDTAPDRLREAQAAGVTVLHKPVGADVLKEQLSNLLAEEARGTGTVAH
jgi:signal transduction histidine kinase/ActR/RegA family two-component response regulator